MAFLAQATGETDRCGSFRPIDEGEWLLHGHVHEKWRQLGRTINVGVDVWDFTPVAEDAIIRLINEPPRHGPPPDEPPPDGPPLASA
ncbi:MAG: hypothetical protein ACYDH5_13145 [Acidimicrobiales bacterium]